MTEYLGTFPEVVVGMHATEGHFNDGLGYWIVESPLQTNGLYEDIVHVVHSEDPSKKGMLYVWKDCAAGYTFGRLWSVRYPDEDCSRPGVDGDW